MAPRFCLGLGGGRALLNLAPTLGLLLSGVVMGSEARAASAELGAHTLDDTQTLSIASDSECPSSEAVQEEVRELTTPERRRAVPAGSEVVISDRGASLAVAITREGSTTVRSYKDPARDCERRRHFAAVLVVITLMPPELADEPEPEPPVAPPKPVPEPEPKPEPKPAPKPPRAKLVRIELGGLAEVATPIEDSAEVASFGGELCVALGRGALRFTLAPGYFPISEMSVGSMRSAQGATRAELERLQLASGIRLRLLAAPVGLGIDLQAIATRSAVSGLTPVTPSQDTAFDLGARVGLRISFAEHQLLSPFLGAQASVFPSSSVLSKLPQGPIGHLPYLWLGLSAGLALSL